MNDVLLGFQNWSKLLRKSMMLKGIARESTRANKQAGSDVPLQH